MQFLVSRFYDIVTPESAKDGDIAESGEVYTNQVMDVRQTVAELGEMMDTSSWPIRFPTEAECVWACSEPAQDYRTGEYRSESVHVKNIHGGDVRGSIMLRLLKLSNLVSR